MTYFYIDLIALGVILISAFVGLRRGFFATLLTLLGFLGTFVLAFFFSDNMLLLLDKLFGIASWLVNTLGESVGRVVGIIISIIITYILIRCVVFLINSTIGKLFKGKVLGGINAFLGFFLGALKGGLYVAIALVLINVASLIPSVKTWTQTTFSQTYVIGSCYNQISVWIGDFFHNNNVEEEPAEDEPAEEETGGEE